MRRVPWLILLAFLLCFCAEPSVVSSPTPTPTADDRRPAMSEPAASGQRSVVSGRAAKPAPHLDRLREAQELARRRARGEE